MAEPNIPLSILQTVRQQVKESLTTSNDVVKAALINAFTDKEVERRTSAVQTVFEKIESTEMTIRKIRPSYMGYDASGKGVGEPMFTKEQSDDLKKHNEQLQKLEKALELALVSNDFSKAFEIANAK